MYTTLGVGLNYKAQLFSSRSVEPAVPYKGPQENEPNREAAFQRYVKARLDSIDARMSHEIELYEKTSQLYFEAAQDALTSLISISREEKDILNKTAQHLENAIDKLSDFPFKQEYKQEEEIKEINPKEEGLTIGQALEQTEQKLKNLQIGNQKDLSRFNERGAEALSLLDLINIETIRDAAKNPEFYDMQTIEKILEGPFELAGGAAATLYVLLQEIAPAEQTDEPTTNDSGSESEGSTLTGSPPSSSSALGKMA